MIHRLIILKEYLQTCTDLLQSPSYILLVRTIFKFKLQNTLKIKIESFLWIQIDDTYINIQYLHVTLLLYNNITNTSHIYGWIYFRKTLKNGKYRKEYYSWKYRCVFLSADKIDLFSSENVKKASKNFSSPSVLSGEPHPSKSDDHPVQT